MEWIERLNQAIAYIETHLTEEIDYDQLAKIACCSTYHFQRMFGYMADVPLSEYIRRRRMSLAAVDLQSGEEKVLDVALKYGYASPTAFNRAFQAIHGVTPSQVKAGGAAVKSFPPISFKIVIRGAAEMNYRIEKKEAFRIVGISQPLSTVIEENFAVVPQMWQQAATDGTLQKLLSVMDSPPMAVLGVSACGAEEQWRYYIAVPSTQPVEPAWESYEVPAATWAVFPGEGTNLSIQALEKQIVTEWLPTSGYEYANGPDIEAYFNADPAHAVYEVWIPVTRKG